MMALRASVQISSDPAQNGRAVIEIPREIVEAQGLKHGTVLEFQIHREDGGHRLVLEAVKCPGSCTVVEDRYGGAYSGSRYVAWPLPEAAIPPDSQGGDIAAGLFWAEPHLCGRGDTPEAALADLERRLIGDKNETCGS